MKKLVLLLALGIGPRSNFLLLEIIANLTWGKIDNSCFGPN